MKNQTPSTSLDDALIDATELNDLLQAQAKRVAALKKEIDIANKERAALAALLAELLAGK